MNVTGGNIRSQNRCAGAPAQGCHNGGFHAHPVLHADAFGAGHFCSHLLCFTGLGRNHKDDGDARWCSAEPAVTTKGKGTATLRFNTATKKLSWTVRYSGLSGPAKAAHIHGPAEKGQNADPVVPFEGKLKSPIKGSATLTDAQATDLEAGKYYVNIHTAAHADGEIRGQIEKAK